MTPRALRARVMAAARIVGALALASVPLAAVSPPASAADHATAVTYANVSGSGSSWAAVAIDQWALDKRQNGIVVNYNPDGSATGRNDWESDQADFVGSDPPFRNGSDELGGTGAENPTWGYSYVPDVAGGTAFMYHLTVAGHLVTNLRLSGPTLMKIFTGQITNWNDPAITHDYGAALPALPITPVVRSDGSGATFFLTRWMAHVFSSEWDSFCQKVHPGVRLPCPQTEFYPQNFGNAKAENGSTNVANYITSSYGNGSIGYDEYAYALASHYPVVKVLNAGGYYVLPSASNVAVALTRAQIDNVPSDPNYLQQNLDSVYTFTDPRSYPLSSYSYFIVPRQGASQAAPSNFNNAKGATLSNWLNFDLCTGQKQVIQLGYSPLPINLVKGGLTQIDHIPGHVATTPVSSLAGCDNPTFVNGQNILLNTAPYPSPCDKLGAPLNCVVKNGKPTATGSGTNPRATTPGGTLPGSTTGPGGGTNPGTTGNGPAPTATSNGPVTGVTVNLASANRSSQVALATITTASIIAAIAIPPALAAWLRRRRQHD